MIHFTPTNFVQQLCAHKPIVTNASIISISEAPANYTLYNIVLKTNNDKLFDMAVSKAFLHIQTQNN